MVAFKGISNAQLAWFYSVTKNDNHKSVIRRELRNRKSSIKKLKGKEGKGTPALLRQITDLCSTDLRTIDQAA